MANRNARRAAAAKARKNGNGNNGAEATESKSFAKYNASNPKIAHARETYVDVATSMGKGSLKLYRELIKLSHDKVVNPADAKLLVVDMDKALQAHRAKNHDNRPAPQASKSRISEMRTILGMSAWPLVWEACLDYFKDVDFNRDDCYKVAMYLKRGTGKKAKAYPKTNDKAPARDTLMRAVRDRKEQRSRNRNATNKVPTYTDTQAESIVPTMIKRAKGLKKWFNGDGKPTLIDGLLRQLSAIDSEIAKVAKARAKEAAAE